MTGSHTTAKREPDGNAPMSSLQLQVLLVCGLVVLLDGYDIQTMALAVPSIAHEWSIASGSFGMVLAAALVGMAIGAALIAPLGDRLGRRPILIWSVLIVGLASTATAFSDQLWQLIVWRFATGVGLGGSLPNATALTSEYMPARRRAALVTLMFCNVALGAIIAGFTAQPVIGRFGWQGLFLIGGILPLVLAAIMYLRIPESIKFLQARSPNDPRLPELIQRSAIEAEAPVNTAPAKAQSIGILLSKRFRVRTLLLWTAFCLNLFAMYLLISWLPTMLQQAGWPPHYALPGAVLLNLGGMSGGLAIAWYVDRGQTSRAMTIAYALTALSLWLFMIVPSDSLVWWLLLFSVGIGTSGTQLALNALSAAFYPASVRTTGVGWSYSIGRVGAIMGPICGGLMLQAQVTPTQVLGILIVPVLACATCVAVLRSAWRHDAQLDH
jgi:MFS transporter, AAHS family, 4-hydroxybenzoate transporter